MKFALKTIRKVLVLISGGFLLLAGLLMLITPGPGWVAIFGGLALLSTEFPWAKRVTHQLKEMIKALFKKMGYKGPDIDQLIDQHMNTNSTSKEENKETLTQEELSVEKTDKNMGSNEQTLENKQNIKLEKMIETRF